VVFPGGLRGGWGAGLRGGGLGGCAVALVKAETVEAVGWEIEAGYWRGIGRRAEVIAAEDEKC